MAFNLLPDAAAEADLVARLTLDEKIAQLSSFNPGVPRLGVPPASYSEALHGVVAGCGSVDGADLALLLGEWSNCGDSLDP